MVCGCFGGPKCVTLAQFWLACRDGNRNIVRRWFDPSSDTVEKLRGKNLKGKNLSNLEKMFLDAMNFESRGQAIYGGILATIRGRQVKALKTILAHEVGYSVFLSAQDVFVAEAEASGKKPLTDLCQKMVARQPSQSLIPAINIIGGDYVVNYNNLNNVDSPQAVTMF